MARLCRSPKACLQCGDVWLPKYDATRFCSRYCVWLATKGREYSANLARESAAHRGDLQRNRGEGKSYRKRMGRHEHRHVAERALGRPLRNGEVVRFKDGNRRNTAADNLEVLPSQSALARLTFLGRKHSAEHVEKREAARQATLRTKRGEL